MTRNADTPIVRERARWLLAHEIVESAVGASATHVLSDVFDKLRRPLTMLAGAAGFRVLLARALALARKESPLLAAWEVGADGSLKGMNGGTEQSSAILVAHFIGLMITFIGESLTLRILQDVWLDLPDSGEKLEKDDSQ